MIRFIEPLVLRRPGMPFSRLAAASDVGSLLDDPQFVDCLATMHPEVLRRAHKRSRRGSRTLYRYLARFCARNDSSGVAGVTVWGRLTDGDTVVKPGTALRRVVWPAPGHEVAPDLCQRMSQASGTAFAEMAPDRHSFVCDAAPVDGELLLSRRAIPDLEPWFRLAAWHQWQREKHLSVPVETGLTLAEFLMRSTQLPRSNFGEDLAQWQVRVRDDVLHVEEQRRSADFEKWLEGKRFVSTLDLMFDRRGGVLISEAHSGGEGLPEPTLFPRAHDVDLLKGHAETVFGPHLVLLRPPQLTPRASDILLQLKDATFADPHSMRVPEAPYNLLTEVVPRGTVRNVGYPPFALAPWAGMLAGLPVNHTTLEVRLGDIVLARPSLRLPAAIAWQAIEQKAISLPRYVYVSTRGKPLPVDLESELARQALAADLQHAEHAVITPMQPGPDDLMLDDYTSEVRMVCVYGNTCQ